MGIPPSTSNKDKRKITKRRGKATTSTTSVPLMMLGTSNYKEENKRPGRGGKHNGSINTREKFSRIMYKQHTGKGKKVRKLMKEGSI